MKTFRLILLASIICANASALDIRKNGQTSNIIPVMIYKNDGTAYTGLSSSTSGLIISTRASTESSPTTYAQASSNIETITTPGTFAAPTSGKCRFKEVDATNMAGAYEIQIDDARFAVSNARWLNIHVSGAANIVPFRYLVRLIQIDLDDATRAGLAALPNAAAEASGGLITRGSSTGQLNVSSGIADANTKQWNGTTVATPATAGVPDVNVKNWGNATATGMPMPTYTQPTGFLAATFPGTVASTTNITAGTITTVTTLTNLPAITSNWLTAAGIASGALDGKGNWNIGKTGYALTSAYDLAKTAAQQGDEMTVDASTFQDQIASAVWEVSRSEHSNTGTFGAALNSAQSAGDPWATPLPGAYGSGTAGYAVGTYLDGKVSDTGPGSGPTADEIVEAVFSTILPGPYTGKQAGALIYRTAVKP